MWPRRKKRHEEHEEHDNHERWLVTYADMITLLMVLFIVLFAISQIDLQEVRPAARLAEQHAWAARAATPSSRAAPGPSTAR